VLAWLGFCASEKKEKNTARFLERRLTLEQSFFGFGSSCDVDIVLDDGADKQRKQLTFTKDGVTQKVRRRPSWGVE
jgi:hypothetical protein